MMIELLAWSGDGRVALVQRTDEIGIAWVLVDAAGGHEVGLPASSVKEKDCRAAVAALGSALESSFEGVTLRPEKCATDRQAVVATNAYQKARVEQSWNPAGVEIKRHGKLVRLVRAGGRPELLDLPRTEGGLSWASAGGPLMLVVETTEGSRRLLGAVVDTAEGLVTVELSPDSPDASAALEAPAAPFDPDDPFGLDEP